MALGGGTFLTQNKELPGTYINFVSVAQANANLSDRGIATMPLELDWGVEDKIFQVTNEDFQKNSLKLFGYDYAHETLKGLRDLFLNTRLLYAYRVNGGGSKASCDIAEAVYSGKRGNDIKIIISKNKANPELYDVVTMVGSSKADEQTVTGITELVPNDFVTWKTEEGAEHFTETPGMALAGGSNGTADSGAYQKYLDKAEAYTFNTMGAVVTDEATKGLFAAYVKRLRDECGVKFQVVLHDYKKADYMGVISVKNKTVGASEGGAELVYWVTGASAGCAVNKSLQNTTYNGEYEADVDLTQTELKEAIKKGEFVFHRVGEDVRALEDINTMVTTTSEQGDIFKDNQTIRVIDQIGNDIAVLFNTKYLGIMPNDNAGRVSLWADIVAHHRQLETIRAIENFSDADVTVEQGDTKKAVVVKDYVTVVNAMSKLYMTVTVA